MSARRALKFTIGGLCLARGCRCRGSTAVGVTKFRQRGRHHYWATIPRLEQLSRALTNSLHSSLLILSVQSSERRLHARVLRNLQVCSVRFTTDGKRCVKDNRGQLVMVLLWGPYTQWSDLSEGAVRLLDTSALQCGTATALVSGDGGF